jgi:hypothetical protein
MTIVAGLVSDNKVYIGADSLSVSDDGSCCIDTTTPKVFRIGEYVFGCAGCPRLRQILRYCHMDFPPVGVEDHDALTGYMVDIFIRELQDFFSLHHFTDEFKEDCNSILIGFTGRLFCLYSDYNLEECKHPYNAIGCAADIALGSLHATARMNINPIERLRLALEASEHLNAHVKRPFIYEESSVR